MTLTDFLLARIAEDEATAHQWHRARYVPDAGDGPAVAMDSVQARVLAECEAKRQIVGRLTCEDEDCGDPDCIVVREDRLAIAAVYADHPDFRDEWHTTFTEPPV